MKLKAAIFIILILFVAIGGAALVNTVVNGEYTVDADNFTAELEYGDDVSIDGLVIVDNRTFGVRKIEVTEDMIVRGNSTASAGTQELVIRYDGKEYTVCFNVKYRVEFVSGTTVVDTQLVARADELVFPDAPTAPTGYEFSHWDIDTAKELTASTTVKAVFKEISYPSLAGIVATYGDTLGSIALPKNALGYWEFTSPTDTPVGNAGNNEFDVRFVFYDDPAVYKYDFVTVEVMKRAFDFGTFTEQFYYDGEAHVPTLDTDLYYVLSGNAETLPGTYTYSYEIIDSNYYGVYEGSYEILKPTVTVTVSSHSIVYPEAVPEFTFVVEGFENVELLGIKINAPEFASAIGTYDVGITYTNENVNYIIHNGTLSVYAGELAVEAPEIGTVTFEDKLADIEFLGKYLGTWAWESPETVVDSMDGITAYAIFTHDDPNYIPVRMEIKLENVQKKKLEFEITESTFVYEAGKERVVGYSIVGGLYPELYKTLEVIGNTPVINAGTYTRTLSINDSRYEGTVTLVLTVNKAIPETDFSTVPSTVWNENLRLESITLPEGYSWQIPAYKITESGKAAYAVTFTPRDTDNYLAVDGEITVEVAKAELTVAGVLDSYVKTYDKGIFDIKNSGIAVYYTDGELTVKYYKDGTEVSEIVNAGEYLLVIKVSEGKNYLGTTIERSVTVERAENSESVNTAQSAVYLDSISTLTLPEGVEGTWSWLEGEIGNAGTKTLTAVFTPDENANYLERRVAVTVTVEKKTLTAPTPVTTLGYNGHHQTLTVDESELYELIDLGGKDVGIYTATVKVTDPDNYKWANGTDSFTVTYSIIPADNAFTYLPEDGITFPYLSTLEALTALAKFGGVKAEYKPEGAPDTDYTEAVPKDVGIYTVRYTTTDSNCTAYLTETRTFSITPIEVVPSPYIINAIIRYNGEKQYAELADTVDGIYTVHDSGATNVDDFGVITLTIFNHNYVWADGSSVLTLYYLIVKSENSWVVMPSVPSDVTYGEAIEILGQPKYDSIEVYHKLKGSLEYLPGLPTDAGKYDIMFTTSCINAYVPDDVFTTLTIHKKEIPVPTANASLVYNGTAQLGVNSPSEEYLGIYRVENNIKTYAGSYVATATIINSNYKWAGTDSDSVEIAYSVAKAQGALNVTHPTVDLTYSGESFLDTVKDSVEAANGEQTELVYTVTSFVKPDGTALAVTDIIGAGRYVITVSVAETDNYLSATATVTVTVNKLSVTIPTVTDKVYTGKEQSAGVLDTDKYTVSGDLSATGVGSYSVSFTLTDPDNHEWLGRESEVTVVREYAISLALNSWTVEPENVTALYSGNPVTVTASALHGTVTIVYTIGGVAVDAPIGAGVYNVTVTAKADNYSDLVAYVTVTVTKVSVSVPTAGALTYNGTEQGITITDEALGTLYTVDSETKATEAGAVATVTLKLTDSLNYKWSTTAAETVTLSVTVGKADIVIDGAPTIRDWMFGDDEPKPTADVIDAQKDFPGLTVTFLYALTAYGEYMSYAALPKTDYRLNAGTYYVKAVVEGTSNYNGDETEAVAFTVSKCELPIPTANASLTYDGTYKSSGITSSVLFTVVDQGGYNAGNYYAYVTLTDTDNFKWLGIDTDTATVAYSVAKLSINSENVDNSGKSAQYGEAIDLTASIVGVPAGVDLFAYVSYLYSADNSTWYESLDALTEALGTSSLGAGTYYVKTTLGGSDNWQGTETTDTFEITKKAVALPTPSALTYNGTAQSAFLDSALYTVSGGYATAAGSHTATLTLCDSANYKWQSTDSASVEIGYTVAKAMNSWSTAPAISSTTVTYKDGYTVSGAPLYDTLKYKYKSSLDADYTLIDSPSELPTSAGSYEIVLYTESVNAYAISATLNLTINRKTVAKPAALPTFVYDGGVKTHGITASEGFVIKASADATNAGETVSVTLALSDSNYVWSDGTTADTTLTSTVAKAGVTLNGLTAPSITYTETPAPSVSVDKAFASSLVKYSYSLDKVNYYALNDLTKGGYLPAGTYWVKAYVESSNVSYSETAAVSFTVAKATPSDISISWSGAQSGGLYYQNLLSVNKASTTVTYNGKAVSIAKYDLALDGGFKGADTVYKITVTPADTDNYNGATFTVNVPLKSVATIGFGGTAYGSIEDALRAAKSGDTVWVKTDVSGNLYITENIEIPAGVTLLIPYGDATDASGRNQSTASTLEFIIDNPDTPEDENEFFDIANTHPEKYRKNWVKLAPNVTLTVNGVLEISGVMCGGGGGYMSGHTAGNYATLELEDSAKIKCYGTIKCFGFIENAAGNDNGSLTVYSGGSVSMPLVLYDYKGGTLTTAIYEDLATNKTAPFHQFGFQNISIAQRIEYGAMVNAWCNLNTTDRVNSTVATFVGNTSDYFLQLTNSEYSYLEAKFDPLTKITDLKIYGGARLNSFSLTVEALGKKETVHSKDFYLAISWLYNITLDNAVGQDMSYFEMLDGYKIMAGAVMTVEEGAKLTAGLITIYDDTFVDRLGGYGISTGIYPTVYPAISTLKGIKLAGGKLVIRGELEVRDLAGDVYADSDGAKLSVSGKTTIETKEPTIINKGLIFGSVDEHQTVVRSLRLIYVDSYGNELSHISAIIKTENGAIYTSDSESKSWVTDANVEYITITLPTDVRVTIDSVVLVDENGNFVGFGSYDSSLGGAVNVVEGTLVLFHLRADQLVVTNGANTLTLDSAGDIKTSAYEYTWSAGTNVPTIYSGVPVLTLTGYSALSECTVTYKNLGTDSCYIEISMKKTVSSINVFSSITASFSVSATNATTTGTGSFSKSGRLTVTVSTTVKVYANDTVTVR